MLQTDLPDSDLLDGVYERLRDTGPEFDGWLSNHGPMAADALARIGHADQVDAWLEDYLVGLDDPPVTRWAIDPSEWEDWFGDHRRLGDWTAYFEREVEAQPWPDLLETWWPRLLPGAVAAATHGLIRTGHAIRALTEHDTANRRLELAHGLGYWAARWQPLPSHPPIRGAGSSYDALGRIAAINTDGGIRERLTDLAADQRWPEQQSAARPVRHPDDVPAALDALVDATVARYADWGRAAPVMLVHASTAPRAAALAIQALPLEMWVPTYQVAWAAAAALTAVYRPITDSPPATLARSSRERDELSAAVCAQGDAHGIKFAEVAFESHARGSDTALLAVERALEWLAG